MSKPKICHTPETERLRKTTELLNRRIDKLEETYRKTVEWNIYRLATEPPERPHQGHQ